MNTDEIHLPRENNAALTRVYGTPSSRLWTDYFNWPKGVDVRLYTRNGMPLTDHDGDMADDHKCHPKLVDSLEAALREIYVALGKTRFEAEGWHVYGGCHNYRAKRGGSGLSVHSWAAAIDINPEENPYRSDSTTFSRAAIDIMEKHGFLSGGRAWGKDWMHFQAAIPFVSRGSWYYCNGFPKHIKII